MSQIRLGVDVVSISRLEDRLRIWPKLAARIFSPEELSYARSRPHPAQHLAVRLAAKEATFKALGSGWPSLSWLEVEISSAGGGPSLRLWGRVEAMAGECTPLVSLSHDGGIAVAQVLLISPGLRF